MTSSQEKSFKEFISEIINVPEFKVKEPHSVRYIIDKSFFLSWIERVDKDYIFTRMLIDLFVKLKERINLNIIIPVEVLEELASENKKWVKSKPFLKFISFLASDIKRIKPDKPTAKNSVMVLADKYNEQSIPCVILTAEKGEYENNINKNLTQLATPKDILLCVTTLC